ncbi:hypothetical protein SNEBB_001255 [Seison nebaliae]|nr:hypothetical protein SNEBB_001255 [Seison nebaliae]
MSNYVVMKTAINQLKGATHANPYNALYILYNKILRNTDKMPIDCKYRMVTENMIKEKMKLLETEKDVEELTKKLISGYENASKPENSDSMSEIIRATKNEYQLSRQMITWKAWEPIATKPSTQQWQWPIV